MEVSDQLHAPAALLLGKEPPVPIVWEAGWAPKSIWMLWRREICLTPAGNRAPIPRPSYNSAIKFRISTYKWWWPKMEEVCSDLNEHCYVTYSDCEEKYLLTRFSPIAPCGLTSVTAAFYLTMRLIISAYKRNPPSTEWRCFAFRKML
jgi:hypothetical protein